MRNISPNLISLEIPQGPQNWGNPRDMSDSQVTITQSKETSETQFQAVQYQSTLAFLTKAFSPPKWINEILQNKYFKILLASKKT